MSEASEPGDIRFSTRDDLGAHFSDPLPVTGLNTDADDRDPWLSADGKRLYFSSDRVGELDIYVAELKRP
jgi:Tol biopolymer transport system component